MAPPINASELGWLAYEPPHPGRRQTDFKQRQEGYFSRRNAARTKGVDDIAKAADDNTLSGT